MSYQTLRVEQLDNGQIVKIVFARPKKLNAMNPAFFDQIGRAFRQINQKQNVRVVILTADGRAFTSGLDLMQYGSLFTFDPQTMQPARFGIKLYNQIRYMQNQCLAMLQCKVPVLIGIHNFCVGGGIDLISMGDVRYCTKDAKFTIKEIDIGMAADLGTLQLLPNIIGNQSTFRELAFTGRWMQSQQASKIGLVSKVFEDKQAMQKGLLQTAKIIASKSPVGIFTLKDIMRRQIKKKAQQGMQYMAKVNTSRLLTKDTMIAIQAWMNKDKPVFPKL